MLSTNIGNLQLSTCIYNASGPLCTSNSELLNLFDSDHNALVLTKSCTLNPRIGNPEPRYYQTDNASINSTGLANLGYQKYIEFADIFSQYIKPYFISVSGLSLDDNVKIIREINQNHNIQGIELNLSCPNIIGKPQIGYDFEAVQNTLDKVFEIHDNKNQIVGLKLPPYFDYIHYETMTEIIKSYPKIQFLTCINSVGNGLIVDPENESVTIKPKNGFGGIGGSIIKPISLANVHQFYKLFDGRLSIIGCGGITNGQDVFEHILCGASAVQIGTQCMREGIKCFERIERELLEIMGEKGYNNLEELRGKLKYL